MLGNGPIQEIMEPMVGSVRAALPDGWRAQLLPDGADTLLRVTSRTGDEALFAALGTGMSPRELPLIIQNAELRTQPGSGRSGFVVMSPYLSEPKRAALEQAGLSYADATGWVRLVSERPMLAITAIGADRSPLATIRRQTLSLKGASAGRIVQALLSISPPIGVRELAEAANVSPGTVSKVLPLLDDEDGVTRDPDGKIVAVNHRRVLNRWVLDYGVLKSSRGVRYFVAPRGLDKAREALTKRGGVAFTGALAVRAYLPSGVAPLVPPTQIVCYASDTAPFAASIGLQEVDAPAANVILAVPQDKAILDDPTIIDGVPVAPLPVVLADLMTLPGRYPQQAEALMDALAKTDPAWRP